MTDTLLTSADIAEILQVATRVVAEKYAMRPDFPTPIRLPSLTGKGHCRWRRDDVNAWIDSLQRKR